MCKLGVISQERLKIEVKLLLSAKEVIYAASAIAQLTLSDLEWPFHPHRALSLRSVAELCYVSANVRCWIHCVRLSVHPESVNTIFFLILKTACVDLIIIIIIIHLLQMVMTTVDN